MLSDNNVFVKTSKGRQILSSHDAQLARSWRSILILVDGSRNVATLQSISPSRQDTKAVLQSLLEQGYIALLAGLPEQPITKVAHSVSSATDNQAAIPKRIDIQRKTILALVDKYFGFMAAPHAASIQSCQDLQQLSQKILELSRLLQETQSVAAAKSFLRDCEAILRA